MQLASENGNPTSTEPTRGVRKSKRRASVKDARLDTLETTWIAAGLSPEILCVQLGKRVPLLREIIEREDRRYGTDWHAGAAVNALYRIDVEQLLRGVLGIIFLRMNAIHWTRVHARCVFGVDARFSNYIGHNGLESPELDANILLRLSPRKRTF